MHVLILKIIFICLMIIVSLVTGLIPLFLYKRWTKRSEKLSTRASLIVSLLSCFSGGVILCVSWLDILPNAKDDFDEMQEKIGHKIFSAFVELFMALGFFLVYLIEELIGEFFTRHSEQKNKQKANNELVEMKRSSSITQYDTIKLSKPPKEHKALVNVYTFISAITFHMFMEGFLFGAQTKVLSLSSLFFGIIVHKILVLFSIGIKLARQLEDRTRLAVAFIFLLSFSSPLSALVGLLVQSSFNNNAPGATFSTIISSLSVGTFTYIALFEILIPERNAPYSKLLQWLSCFVGFALMAGIIVTTG